MDMGDRIIPSDLAQIATDLLEDLDVPDEVGAVAQAELDAIGTLTGLNENDLVALTISLARQVLLARQQTQVDPSEG